MYSFISVVFVFVSMLRMFALKWWSTYFFFFVFVAYIRLFIFLTLETARNAQSAAPQPKRLETPVLLHQNKLMSPDDPMCRTVFCLSIHTVPFALLRIAYLPGFHESKYEHYPWIWSSYNTRLLWCGEACLEWLGCSLQISRWWYDTCMKNL